jgi:hypothetical protein
VKDGEAQYTSSYTAPFERYTSLAKRADPAIMVWNEIKVLLRTQLVSRPYKDSGAPRTLRFKRAVRPLGAIYDEKGRKHKFDIFIVETSDVPQRETKRTKKSADTNVDSAPSDESKQSGRQEVPAGELAKAMSGRAFVLVGRKCSTCGLVKGGPPPDTDVVLQALRDRRTKANFYAYYETRCPLGGVHVETKNAEGHTVCSKCGHDQNQSAEYFEKYRDKYLAALSSEEAAAVQPSLARAPERVIKKFEYKRDDSAVIKLASLFSINSNLLNALGAMERQSIDDVLTGKFRPAEPTNMYDARIFLLDAYLRKIRIKYQQLLSGANLDADTTRFLEEINVSSADLRSVTEQHLLPEILRDYDEHLRSIRATGKPQDAIDFVIQSICTCLLEIHETASSKSDVATLADKLRKAFVRWQVNSLLLGEERTTKHGHFPWSLLYGNGTESEDSTELDQDGDETAAADDETEEGESAPFSMNAFDTEDEEAREDEDYDGDNDIKVENYGLD